MGLSLAGSLGFGISWMSASFHAGDRQPNTHKALSMAISAASPAGQTQAIMEYDVPAAPQLFRGLTS